jgi:hypothetical protein
LFFPREKLEAQIPQDSNLPPDQQVLTSYEGQTVTGVDIAGRPDLRGSQVSPQVAVSVTRDPHGGVALDTLIKKTW